MKGGGYDSYQLVGRAFDGQRLQDLGLVILPNEREAFMTGTTLILIIGAVLLVVGIEYLTRGVPSPWRWVILGIAAIVLLFALVNLLGLM